MIKLITFLKNNYLMFLVVFLALFLRFRGIYPGYPAHTDEAGYSSALLMLSKGNLDPGRYDYPSGVPLIQLFLFKFIFIPFGWVMYYLKNLGSIVDGFMKISLSNQDYQRIFQLDILGNGFNAMYWGRYITAGFGVGIVILIYLLSRLAFNNRVAIISAFLVATNFRQVLNSHLGLPDIFNSFFLILMSYFLYKIIYNPSKINYFLAGLANGVYFSIKFQTFGFIPILIAHLIATWNQSEGYITNIKRSLFSPKLMIAILTSALFMVFVNPYIFINFELFKAVQGYQLSKYGIGSDSLYLYPISYLYQIGIGKFISILSLFGLAISLVRYFKKSVILMLIASHFMITFIYLSRGGFYTRNFVTITPILLIFSAILINDIFSYAFGKKWLFALTTFCFVLFISFQNIKYSVIVGSEYVKPWNINILSDWIRQNIPEGSVVAAHSNTPLPVKNVKRTTYELDDAFSIDEFKENASEYAISNSSWTTNSFYWWMGGGIEDYIKHLWNKPVNILEYSYPALALRELSQFNVYSISNPWQAPDTDFLVAKIPEYKITSKELVKSFDFENNDGWIKSGTFWTKSNNLEQENGALIVTENPATLPSLRWESPPVDVSGWKGYQIDYQIMSETKKKNLRTGYIFVNYYKNIDDAKNSINRIGIRLSERNMVLDKWIEKSLIGQLSDGVKYITIGFYNYAPAESVTKLGQIKLYKADVTSDFNGVNIHPIQIDQNNLFPNSHGNL